MLEFLFESGCNIAAQDNSGQTAAHYGEHTAVDKQAVSLESFFRITTCNEWSPNNSLISSHSAAQEDNNECISTLYELGLVRQAYELQLVS